MCQKRYHIEIEPGCIGTFNTPTPSSETIRILKDVIAMAMKKEAPCVSGSEGERSEVPAQQDGTPETRGHVVETPKN